VSKLTDDGEILRLEIGNRILITMVVKNERRRKKHIFSND
jgi:hypothetical protein